MTGTGGQPREKDAELICALLTNSPGKKRRSSGLWLFVLLWSARKIRGVSCRASKRRYGLGSEPAAIWIPVTIRKERVLLAISGELISESPNILLILPLHIISWMISFPRKSADGFWSVLTSGCYHHCFVHLLPPESRKS